MVINNTTIRFDDSGTNSEWEVFKAGTEAQNEKGMSLCQRVRIFSDVRYHNKNDC